MAERLNGKQCRGFVVCDWLWCITCSSIENSARMKVGQNFLSLNSTYSRSSRTNGPASRVRSRTTVLLYKGLKGRAKIPTDDLIPKNRRCRNQHSLAFQIPSASTNAYLHSFFPQTIRDWNELPDSLISSAELSDDCVSKFTSLVRARD